MRRSEIDSTREAGMPSRFFSVAWLVVLVLFSLPLVSACGGGGGSDGSSGGSKWQGAVTLIPENADSVKVWDIAAIVAGDAPAAIPRQLTHEILGSVLIGPDSIETVNSFATARIEFDGGGGGGLFVMEGDFDFNAIKEILSGLPPEKHGGYELYDTGSRSIALLEGEGSVVSGDPDAVKAVLDALDRGSGFLLHGGELRRRQYTDYSGVDPDEYVHMTLNRAGGGFFTKISSGVPGHLTGSWHGWASGWSASAGNGSEVKLRIFFPSQQEKYAKANEDQVKAWFEAELDEGVKLESVEVDGLFIIGTATGNWDDGWIRVLLVAPTRNSDGNPDYPQAVVFLTSIIDVTVGS